MTEPRPADERMWESGWEDHERAQLRRLARLPLSEKLRWLEEAQRVVRHLAGQGPALSPERGKPSGGPSR